MPVTNAQIDAAVPPAGTPDRALTNSVLRGIRDDANAAKVPTAVSVAAAEGGTVTLPNNVNGSIVTINIATDLEALTIALPPAGSIGNRIIIVATGNVADVTWTGATTQYGLPPAITLGDVFSVTRVAESAWALI